MRADGDTAVDAAYDRCRRMQRRHDPTFYLATSRLPAETRPAVHALYGFVRGADEIVDGPSRPRDPQARRAALDAWERELRRGLADGETDHPVIAALVDADRRHRLGLERLTIYMDSMRTDCDAVRFRTEDELDRYMDGSAATVGRIMAPVLGAPSLAEPLADLGRAFQLTNFVRDVREDYALDRVYLPGVDPDDVRTRHATPAFRDRVAAQVRRARELFAATEGVERELPASMHRGVRFARAVYLKVLDRAEAAEFDVLARRARPGPLTMAAAAAQAIRG